MSNNLAIILNPCNMQLQGYYKNSNSLMIFNMNDIKKIIEFYQKNIKIAIKTDRVKMAIGNIIVNSLSIFGNNTRMNIQKTYVATVNKKYIEKAISFYSNISNLSQLTKKINNNLFEENDTFFKNTDVFNANQDTSLENKPILNDTSNDNNQILNGAGIINPVDFSGLNQSIGKSMENETIVNQSLNQETNKSNDTNSVPIFNAGMEGNLNYALGDNSDDVYKTSKINLNDIPSQTIDKTIAESNIGNDGHIMGKMVAFLVIVLFISSCIFLGYEITKVSEVMPLIKDKYFS